MLLAPPGALERSTFSPETINLGEDPETGVSNCRETLIETKI